MRNNLPSYKYNGQDYYEGVTSSMKNQRWLFLCAQPNPKPAEVRPIIVPIGIRISIFTFTEKSSIKGKVLISTSSVKNKFIKSTKYTLCGYFPADVIGLSRKGTNLP